MRFLIFSALLIFSITSTQAKKSLLELERNILNAIFSEYDPSIRPSGENGTGPVVVHVNTFIRSLSNIDDVKQVYNAQLTFRQSWKDDRLKYENKELNYITLTRLERIWIPDLFFSNEDTGHFHNMITPNNLIRIFPDGTVLYSTRISLSLFCPMSLRNYPLDDQILSIKAASYGYTTADIVFKWKEGDPVQVTKNLHLPKFTLTAYYTDYCTSKTNTGEYSCIKIDMAFSRNTFYYLESAYMPTATLVILSWVVFWLNPRSSNVRMGIWIAVLISTIMITTSINAKSPEVSYTKALDVWMGFCVIFILCVLLELCLVSNCVANESVGRLAINEDDKAMRMEDSVKRAHHFSSSALKWLNKYSTTAQRIDVLSRFLFPTAFAFFNFIYWITYTSRRIVNLRHKSRIHDLKMRFFSALLIIFFINSTQAKKSLLALERNILNAIFSEYDPSIRPSGENGTGPVIVHLNTYIRSLSNIDDIKQVYNAQLTFRQSWKDDRLKYENKEVNYITLTRLERIWVPDLFFSNEDTGHFHNMITPNNYIRIFPDGTVLYSTRISLSLFCPMNLRNYPLDDQILSIRAASYGYTTADIVFKWKEGDPVQMTKNLHLLKFTLTEFYTDYCTSKTTTGEYSCVMIDMAFSRNTFYYLESAYMPTALLVILSWVVFWLNPRSSNERMGIWIAVLVSIIIVTTSINAKSPEVSYTKALDVWMGFCVIFILCVLLELSLVSNCVVSESSGRLAINEDGKAIRMEDSVNRAHHYSSSALKWLNKYPTTAQRIDVLSRFLFPAAFAFFSCIYWITYTSRRM
ncbi:hypothetical protein JTE90_021539 [Oedothorax gibbosus]|uniref:Glutamate-gated chloride channel n=1 Tax=Oedothorax gibbosus TaxID=931172 RepID=A0AAV6VNJ7_9ARAC|nr:hypothetical protein JTE90_021539 [Oedothorax gibbosus]